jgi:hypothetical protein
MTMEKDGFLDEGSAVNWPSIRHLSDQRFSTSPGSYTFESISFMFKKRALKT